MSEQRFSIYRTRVQARGDTLPPPDLSLPPMLASADSTALGAAGPPSLWPAWEWKVGTDTLQATEAKYRPHYTLDFAQGGVALEPAQGGVGQGLQARLSDQLGDRLIYFQVANTANSFGTILSRFNLGITYYNMTHRVNWGVSAFHFAGDFLDEAGFSYFERRVGGAGILSIPLSLYSRIETSLGLVYSNRGSDSFRPARAAPLLTNYISYVHDTTLWLATGPIDGTAARFTLGMNANVERVELENINAAVDLRKYFRLGLRSAYAVRLLGYSSQGAYPNRFILGGSWSFRGYPRRAFVGTRALLLNQEIRFPILRGAALGLPIGVIGLPPVEGAIFADVGQAWSEELFPPDLRGSFGLSFRTSLGGFLVLRLDVARLTDFYRVWPDTEVDFFVGFNY
jgi:outer membrane protein assembly factor BamA